MLSFSVQRANGELKKVRKWLLNLLKSLNAFCGGHGTLGNEKQAKGRLTTSQVLIHFTCPEGFRNTL